MKLSLSVKITIKDFFPKNENISYNYLICLFSHNDFNGKINLRNLTNQNSIKHKVDTFNSNITYNAHILDTKNSSILGTCQLIIYFDKIKNLNINDTLFQEEKIKIIIDPKVKKKIFDKNNNTGDMFLNILTEIKIIDKKDYENENKKKNTIDNNEDKDNNYNLNDNSNALLNSTPRGIKKEKRIKSLKKERESIKRVDTFSNYKELSLVDYLNNGSLKNSATNSMLQKNKSLVKLNKHSIIKTNQNNNNELYGRHRIINSCIDIISSIHNQTNFNSTYKKEEKNNNLKKKSSIKKKIPKKKVTILNLMEKRMEKLLYKQKEENIFDYNNLSKDFKNTSTNFCGNQIKKISLNVKKSSSRTINKYKSIKSKEKMKNNNRNNKNIKNFGESDFFRKNKDDQSKNKIFVCINLTERNKESRTLSNHKIDNENKKRKIIPKKLSLNNTGRLYTEMNMNMNKTDLKNNFNGKINSDILQTEINRNISEMRINIKKNKNKLILTDLDLEKLIIEKGAYIKGNFQNYYLKEKEKNRGYFSPKLSLKFKFKENTLYNNYNDNYDYKYEPDRFSYRIKDINNPKILTPKGNQIKINSFANNFTNEDNNFIVEKDEIRKKYINLIDFYSLLSKKLKKTNKNNIEIKKNFQSIKEKYNNLQKQKNKLIQMFNSKETKKIKNKTIFHFEEEQLLNKMINIKLKENSIYQNIFGPEFGEQVMQDKIAFLISQKKELMLNLIKNIVKFYGNISQIYNNDINKKNIFKSLLNKYNIKEKVKIDLNYISYMHKENNFEDKIITEVDEDKENEEDEEEIKQKTNISILINNSEQQIKNEIPNTNCNTNNNNQENNIIKNETINQESDIYKEKNESDKKNSLNNTYDENLNNLIKKILIEQFPENYKTSDKFIYLDKNKYSFKDKIFLAYIEENDVVLKEGNNKDESNDNKYTLNGFYNKYCIEKKDNRTNFVYTKKTRQKYIKMKSNDKDKDKDKEQSMEKKPKNENSTSISDNNEKIQQSVISKLNEIGEFKNSMIYEKETNSL